MKNNMTKLLKYMLCFITMTSLMIGNVQLINATENEKTLKVGFFSFSGYHNIDDDGYRSGYGYEFIQKMLRYSNYTAEYIGYDKTWSEIQEMLENGDIDILTSAQKTPDRENKFDFSEPIGTSAAILTVKAGNDKYISGEYSTYNGIRVGVIEGNSRNDRFEEMAKEKGFTYTLVYYDDIDSMTKDLQNSDNIDAIVTSNLRTIKNEWVLDKFAISPFYAMVKKGNTELLNQVNYAIEQMNSNSVGWKDELFDKYYSGTEGNSISLSSTERIYLNSLKEQNKKVKVLVHPDRAPYSYVEDGKAKGILPDIFEEVAKRLDINYEYILCNSRAEYTKIKKSGKADILLEARNELSVYEDIGYKLTDSFMNIYYAAVEKADFSGKVNSIATIKDAYTSDKNLEGLMDGKKVVYYNSLKECVNAVLDEKVDACYMYDYSGQKFASENVMGNLQSTTVSSLKDSLVFAVSAKADYRLLAVINKGVNSVKDNFVDDAISKNTDFSIGELTIMQLLWRNPIILIAIVILVSLVIILFTFGYQKKKNGLKVQKKNNELERFIGYVCKANSAVTEVNYSSRTAVEYQLVNGHIKKQKTEFIDFDKESIHNLVAEDDLTSVDEFIGNYDIKKIIDIGEDKYFECRFSEESGERWYSFTMTPIPRDYEHPNNIIIFKRDIDDTKRKEIEAKNSLKDALEAANQASESKGSFLSNMSHEIRTPLNAIIGYLTLAKDDDISKEKLERCINNCDVASKHLLQIINDVLDMSSIETGKLKIAHEEFDLKKEITDITTIFFQNAKVKGVEFETHVNELTEEWVVGDQLRLNQVLMNLLSNAVKFTPENGKVQLKIKQLREDNERVYIQFVVADNGIGMSQEYMSRIFKPFEQENAGTAKKFGGSGLGLSITNNLVKMMGGNITVESRKNEGTAFTITMYFGKSKSIHEVYDEQVNYSHIRVLVVDDKEDECTYIKTMLKRCGVKSDYVTNGKMALKRIKSRLDGEYSYDLCIIDWKMPEMNGCEVTRRIRKEIGTDVPIIIATAYDVAEFQDEAKKVGANKIVAKPLFQSTLLDILTSTFGICNTSNAEKEQKNKIDLSGVHLLLAEDNQMNMDIAVTMLEKVGIKVDQATNGKEAFEIFTSKKKGTYDLILMDVQMPVMDGYEATKTIRKSDHPEARTIPIIAMTANAFAEDVAEALANGMNAHIAKPINYDKLYELLKKYSHNTFAV